MSAAITHSHPGYPTNETKNPQATAAGPQAKAPEAHEEQQLIADNPPEPIPESGTEQPKARRPRGFAAMDRKLVSQIARKGGKAAHSAGTAHEFTTEEARVAGRKGGRATHAKRRAQTDETPEATPATAPSKPEEPQA